jgi:putative peptidoglycan lipid II flippase
LPVALWLVMDGDRLVAVLFERGKFSGEDAVLTAKLMALMTPYILFSRIISITQTPFYAVSDTKTLIKGMIWGFFLYLVVVAPSLYFFGVFGFPLATSAAAALGAAVMCYFAQRRFGAMGWSQHKTFLIRLVGALAFGCAGFWVGNRVPVGGFGLSRFWQKAFAAGIPSLLGVAGFGIGAVIFRLADIREISSQIRVSRLRGLLRGRRARQAAEVSEVAYDKSA